MTEQQINIAIAEHIGRTDIYKQPYCDGDFFDELLSYAVLVGTSPDGLIDPNQNYSNDLNAMHYAEKILIQSPEEYSKRGYGAYIKYLTEMVDSCVVDILGLTHLSARQRAEAFLKTIGKWEQS